MMSNREKPKKLSVHGLGHVGSVCAACFAERGHPVVGFDVDSCKVELINAGRSPVHEDGLDEIIARGVRSGRLTAMHATEDLPVAAQLSLICVGTPGAEGGGQDLSSLKSVCEQIGELIKVKRERHTVVVRSTLLPGTTESLVIPLLEEVSGKQHGPDFCVGYNPEFFREGSAIQDFWTPPKTVVGADAAATAAGILTLYAGLSGPMHATRTAEAEMIKFVDNAWHALKVAFANELAVLIEAHGVDSAEVMQLFLKDARLREPGEYPSPNCSIGRPLFGADLGVLLRGAPALDSEALIHRTILDRYREELDKALPGALARGRRSSPESARAARPLTAANS